jgi:hypothetical protein
MLLRIEHHRQGFLSIVDKHFHAEPVQHDPKPEVPIPCELPKKSTLNE